MSSPFVTRHATIEDVHAMFDKWLYMTKEDHEALDIVLSCALDRDFPGDPIWLFLIAPPGDKKTEFLRSMSGYSRVYSIDIITTKTLISGLVEKDEVTGKMVPVAGILEALDGRILVIKDLTTILSMREDVRSEIFGQLRAAYDGYYERGVGSLKEKIRVVSSFGVIAASTSAIDRYTKMLSQLGARFLKCRMSSDEKLATERAFANTGKEVRMRKELSEVVGSFLRHIKIRDIPFTAEQTKRIISIARYIALLRTYFRPKYKDGRIVNYDVPEPEMPTRIAKQLKKLANLLANIRGHAVIEDGDIETLKRVMRDTVHLKRRIIVDEMVKSDGIGIASVIAGDTILHLNSVKNKLEEMEVLGVVEERKKIAGPPNPLALGLNTKAKGQTKYTFTGRFRDIIGGMK